MTSARSILGQLSSWILPGTVLVIVPRLVEKRFDLTVDALFGAGLLLMAGGLSLIVVTVTMFARIGHGTLAPWNPPSTLVTTGVYAYVRNPMISGVLTTLVGEAMAAHSAGIFRWALLFYGINMVYFFLLEEPGLERRFGDDYRIYKRNVPRWIPRFHPWRPAGTIDH